jgi:hypothetical protein
MGQYIIPKVGQQTNVYNGTTSMIHVHVGLSSSINLTPKIPWVFLPNFAVFDIVGKTNFSKNKSMWI